jgi:hypothetical protein
MMWREMLLPPWHFVSNANKDNHFLLWRAQFQFSLIPDKILSLEKTILWKVLLQKK